VRGAADRFGDLVFRDVAAQLLMDESGWAADLVERVSQRLNRVRSGRPLRVVVVWLSRVEALTLPGTYIYVSRELLSRWLNETAAAFVIAREMAHHDLGHIDVAGRALESLDGHGSPASLLALVRAVAADLRFGPEKELAADRRALELCREAGYGDESARQAFALLERVRLDREPHEHPADPSDAPVPGLLAILHEGRRTTPAVHERRQALFASRPVEAPAEAAAGLMVRPGMAATNMVVACAGCSVRFSPAPCCPRCGGLEIHDLREAKERRGLLRLLYSRAIRVIQMPSEAKLPAAIGAVAAAGFALYLFWAGATLIDMLAGGLLVGLAALITVILVSRIGRDVLDDMTSVRHPALVPIAAAPPLRLDARVTSVRGRLHVSREARSPIHGRPCAAWRLSGAGPCGPVDDAGVGRFDIMDGGALRARVEAVEAFVDLVVDEPAPVELTPRLADFFRMRGPLSGAECVLAESFLIEGDDVEVTGVAEKVMVSDGLRGTLEIDVFRAWPTIRRP
jgi:hypothetical protein